MDKELLAPAPVPVTRVPGAAVADKPLPSVPQKKVRRYRGDSCAQTIHASNKLDAETGDGKVGGTLAGRELLMLEHVGLDINHGLLGCMLRRTRARLIFITQTRCVLKSHAGHVLCCAAVSLRCLLSVTVTTCKCMFACPLRCVQVPAKTQEELELEALQAEMAL